MSHIVEVATEIRDPIAIRAACHRLKLPPPIDGEHKLFDTLAEGWGIQLPGWRYPLVCQPLTGKVQFDNYQGRWGDIAELNRFKQGYAVEKAKLEAYQHGHRVTESACEDGSIEVLVEIGGAA
jgi:hypothetical protein